MYQEKEELAKKRKKEKLHLLRRKRRKRKKDTSKREGAITEQAVNEHKERGKRRKTKSEEPLFGEKEQRNE